MSAPAVEFRQRECKWPGCGVIFYVCRSCDRGYLYCSEDCRRQARLEQHRRANHVYRQSFAAKLDQAQRQSAYRERQKMKKVTDQGSASCGFSVSIGSHAEAITFISERIKARTLHGRKRRSYPARKAIYGLLRCLICRRLVTPYTEVKGSS